VRGYFSKGVTLQITILFVLALTVSQLLVLAYRYFAQTEALPALEAIRIADRIAVAASLVEITPRARRARLAGTFSGSNLLVAIEPHPRVGPERIVDERAQLLQDLIAMAVPAAKAANVRVGYASSINGRSAYSSLSSNWNRLRVSAQPLGFLVDEFVNDPTFQVAVPLSDGMWLNITAAYTDTLDFWPIRHMAALGFTVLLVGGLAILAVRRLTAPIEMFASAAARLGTDVNAPPIPVGGPREVRSAIRAFNDMQDRLRRLLDDRIEMVAAMSHDLRTPITRLRLRSERLFDVEQRARVQADLSEMEHMVEDVLNFARDEASVEPTVKIDLGAMIQTICDDMTDRGYCASFDNSPRIHLDCRSRSLRRCFTNIIDNAVRHGGSAEVRLHIENGGVVITVDDRGPGIPAEFREQVFRPFFRVERSRNRENGGTGLGLSVARSVARAHGGDVVIVQKMQRGLRVRVQLPLEIAEIVKEEPQPAFEK